MPSSLRNSRVTAFSWLIKAPRVNLIKALTSCVGILILKDRPARCRHHRLLPGCPPPRHRRPPRRQRLRLV
jgi:hypothetical protein